jgi:hypothetical protein
MWRKKQDALTPVEVAFLRELGANPGLCAIELWLGSEALQNWVYSRIKQVSLHMRYIGLVRAGEPYASRTDYQNWAKKKPLYLTDTGKTILNKYDNPKEDH